MGVGEIYGCGCKEVYSYYLSLLLLYLFFFYSSIPTFCSFKKMFFVLVPVLFCNYILGIK